jgi:hypothetical protein
MCDHRRSVNQEEELYAYCMDLFEIWLDSQHRMDDQENVRALWEEMILAWIKISSKVPTFASRILNFFQHLRDGNANSGVTTIFQIALKVLNGANDDETDTCCNASDNDWLFNLQCHALVGGYELSNSEIRRLIHLLRDKSSTLHGIKAMDVLRQFSKHLTPDEIF